MKKLRVPLIIAAVLVLAYGSLRLFNPALIGETASRYVLAAVLLCLSIVFVRAVQYVLFDIIFMKRTGRSAPDLLRGLLSTILYSLLFVLIYSRVLKGGLGIELLATSTVVSVIIGLALQDTLGNFFAGLSLHVEQPFHILDAIKVGDVLGRVETVTWRTTALRTNNNSVIIFPNAKIARESMEIYPCGSLNRRILRFPAPYSIPPQRVIDMTRETVAAIPNVAPERTPIVRVGEFADSAITYEVLYWVKDYMWTQDIDAKIREHLWYIYRRNEIEVPYPIRHVLMEPREPKTSSEVTDYRAAIDQVDVLEPLSDGERDTVARAVVKRVYAPGELILRQGDPGDSMFIINRGSVEVRLAESNGHQHQVALLERGNFFGEMALLTGEARNADVSALTEVEILEIRKACIQELLDDNTELAEALSRKIAERHATLQEYTHLPHEEQERARTNSMLGRIQRFFGLKH